MSEERWIWIARWEDFQHYRLERDRAPAWIKDYTKQMNDSRYLALSDRQRALLVDLRRVFAVTFPWLPRDSRVITRHRHRQTFRKDLDALNDAGFIEFHSRESIEEILESFYAKKERKKTREETEREEPSYVTPPLPVASYEGEPEHGVGLGGAWQTDEDIQGLDPMAELRQLRGGA